VTAARNIRNLVLAGFMGTGKSSVGRLLAGDLGFAFLDTDALIEKRAGKSISRIFATEGEPAFRDMEKQVVRELADREHCVISTGGGVVVNPENLLSLKTHALVVCLCATPETIFERTRRASHRPLLKQSDPLGRIRTLLEARNPFYRQADILITSDRRSAREVADHVLHEFRSAARGRA
jgi:shikimate kinase